MKLHRENGVVQFVRGSVGPETTRQCFLASTLGQTADVLVSNEPYVTYRIRPESGIAVTLSFEGEILRSIAWMFSLTAEKEGSWTVQHELERKQIHDVWLQHEFGRPPYRFEWGQLSSEYDDKACASDIIATYAR